MAAKKRPTVLKKIKVFNSNSQYLNDQILSDFRIHHSGFFLVLHFLDNQANIECGSTLKGMRGVIRTYNQDTKF